MSWFKLDFPTEVQVRGWVPLGSSWTFLRKFKSGDGYQYKKGVPLGLSWTSLLKFKSGDGYHLDQVGLPYGSSSQGMGTNTKKSPICIKLDFPMEVQVSRWIRAQKEVPFWSCWTSLRKFKSGDGYQHKNESHLGQVGLLPAEVQVRGWGWFVGVRRCVSRSVSQVKVGRMDIEKEGSQLEKKSAL